MWAADERRYAGMAYRRCGRSGLLVPALSLGLWQNFGEAADYERARGIVLHAFDRGITHFDLANNYGPPPGAAECFLGRMLREDLHAHRHEMLISTKAGYRMWPGPYGEWGSRKHMLTSLEQSLRRLGLDHVDILYSHRPDPATPLAETMQAIASAVHQGKALYAGVSNYRVDISEQAFAALRALGTPCVLHQPPGSLLDRRYLHAGFLDLLIREGVGGIVYSPLAQGLLSGRCRESSPDGSRAGCGHGRLRPALSDAATRMAILELEGLATTRGQSLAQMALAWILRQPGVSSVLIGASHAAQIDENIGAIAAPAFADDELAAIEAVCARRLERQAAAAIGASANSA